MKKILIFVMISGLCLNLICGNIPEYLLAQNAEKENQEKQLSKDESLKKGKEDAERKHPVNGWLFGGVASGFTLPLVGPVVVLLFANGSKPKIVPANVDSTSYSRAYFLVSKKKKRNAVFVGGIVGTGILVAFAFDSFRNDTKYPNVSFPPKNNK